MAADSQSDTTRSALPRVLDDEAIDDQDTRAIRCALRIPGHMVTAITIMAPISNSNRMIKRHGGRGGGLFI